MARWEPDAPQRLADAALELFAERGYENTTVLDIARRAGLTKSTFFRHFPNKREVLFAEDLLTEQLVTAITAAPSEATPLEAVTGSFDALGRTVFTPAHRAFGSRRRAVIEDHSDLQEREALKGISLTAALAHAIKRRGTSVVTARVTAELSTLVLKVTYERWSDAGSDKANEQEYGEIARQVLSELHTTLSAL